MKPAATLAPLVERFFTQRLMAQRQVSPHTIRSYRDTFRLLLTFAHQRLHTSPSALALEDVDEPLITAFLDDVEQRRHNGARSRNLRLTAIRSFFRYAAYEAPTHAGQIQRILAIPDKRYVRTLITFLTRAEIEALLAAPDLRTWTGRRDRAFLLVASDGTSARGGAAGFDDWGSRRARRVRFRFTHDRVPNHAKKYKGPELLPSFGI